MTAIVWDQVGERRFETGIDHGVLYLPAAVPWNGLVAVTEDNGGEVKEYFQDGDKFMQRRVLGSYSGKISAFTYPDELEGAMGNPEFTAGVNLHDQRPSWFNLSYRTREGDDLDPDAGYKIHIIYNVMVTPSSVTFDTLKGGTAEPETFDFDISTVPVGLSGHRATSHISINSRRLDPEKLSDLEDTIYGTVSTSPSLPSLSSLLGIVD